MKYRRKQLRNINKGWNRVWSLGALVGVFKFIVKLSVNLLVFKIYLRTILKLVCFVPMRSSDCHYSAITFCSRSFHSRLWYTGRWRSSKWTFSHVSEKYSTLRSFICVTYGPYCVDIAVILQSPKRFSLIVILSDLK